MAASPAAIAAGTLLIATAIAILFCRRAGAFSASAFALLSLWGAATIAAAALTGASDLPSAVVAARLTLWYSIPLPFLLVHVGTTLLAPGGPSQAIRWIRWALAAATILGLLSFAILPDSFLAAVVPFGVGHTMTSGPLLYVLTATTALVEAGLVILAVRVATDASADRVARDRAAWFALAVAIVPIHASGFFVTYIAARPDSLALPLFWTRAIPTLVSGTAALFAIARVGRIPPGAVLASAGAAFALGLLDGVVGAARWITGAGYPGYETSVVLIRVAFALLFSVAVLRFGLADAGASTRAHVARAGGIVAALVTGGAILAFVYLALGATPLALGVALALGASAPFALRTQIASAGRALAARLLLPPDDPRAVAERARTYAAAVAAARGAGAEGEMLLAAMRADLGISEKEHELLVHGVASRDRERYQTIETLGSGATANVSLAVDEIAGKRVVVKRFRALRDPARVLREARAMAAVRHPRVVPFLEVDRRGDEVYLVLAYAEGGSARQLLDKSGPLGVQRAVELAKDLLDGLEALHAQGIVHCDVKPENLLLDKDGRGMLGDFGSAKFAAPDVADATLTGAGAEGSLSTVSPEALRGAPPAPTRDVYAAGALLYRLLTGQHYVALEEATVFDARERITLDAPRLPHARVPASLELVLRKALAKRPENRYQSAREMRDALR